MFQTEKASEFILIVSKDERLILLYYIDKLATLLLIYQSDHPRYKSMPPSCKYRFITMQRTQDRNIKCIKWHSVYSGNQEYYPAFSQLIFQLSCFFYPTFKNGPYYKLKSPFASSA